MARSKQALVGKNISTTLTSKKAQKDGYRSRASYKLLEVQEKDKFSARHDRVIDLGGCPGWLVPGGQSSDWWSRAFDRFRHSEMDSIPDVTFVQGDFTEDAVFAEILVRSEIAGGPL